MYRRVLLSGVGIAVATALTGCLAGGPPTAGGGSGESGGGSDGEDGSEAPGGGDGSSGGDGGTHPRFTETTLTSTGQCDGPGTASIRFGDVAVIVTGCAHGPNGCAAPVLADVSYAPTEDLLRVVVASEVERGEDEACTQALLPLGYEVRVAMDGTVPGAVRVVHDDVDGRREVAFARRDGG
jgi:hypothetical protein